MNTLRLLFGLTQSVSRRTYLIAGFSLAALKYLLDFGLVYITTGQIWTPIAYLSPAIFFRDQALGPAAPPGILWIMALYALPFAWIGLSMSVRRAADGGFSPWWGVGFLVPVVNWVIIALLAIPSSRATWDHSGATETVPINLRNALLGVIGGVLITLAMVAFNIFVLGHYGWTLFLGTPFIVGAICGYLTNRDALRSKTSTIGTAAVAIFVSALAILLLALEGIICLIMAAPIALLLAAAGSLMGRAIVAANQKKNGAALIALVCLLPFSAGFERLTPEGERPLIEVATAVIIDASPMEVWHEVIHFSELAPPPTWVQRTGIAYPIRAEMVGEGVGAVRYCEFSTGPFVEPITAWEPGRRLAFDVVEQPLPMKEWSPYNEIHPPHLDGYLRSKRGEFRLIELPDGRTRLEGSTWYEIDIHPRAYWQLFASSLIQQIHLRVLNHIQTEAEASQVSPS